MIIHCALPSCNTYTDLPDSAWLRLSPVAEVAIAADQTFCSPRCAVLWLEATFQPRPSIGVDL